MIKYFVMFDILFLKTEEYCLSYDDNGIPQNIVSYIDTALLCSICCFHINDGGICNAMLLPKCTCLPHHLVKYK